MNNYNLENRLSFLSNIRVDYEEGAMVKLKDSIISYLGLTGKDTIYLKIELKKEKPIFKVAIPIINNQYFILNICKIWNNYLSGDEILAVTSIENAPLRLEKKGFQVWNNESEIKVGG